jgi:putative ABC transport system substrate-binding protein
MRRREFITLFGGVAAIWPLTALAQAMPVIWYFNSGKSSAQTNNLAAFRQGLKEAGFAEGENVVIQFRWGENQFDLLPALASEVVANQPAIIVSNTLAALQAKTATTTIPIVFTTGSDPVRDGLVTSFNQPGGNVTGVVFISGTLGAKRLELLRQFVPTATTIAMLVHPNSLKPRQSEGTCRLQRRRWG